MIGIDLTKISRFKNVNDKFIKKCLHPEEIKELEKVKNKEKYIATRWAIKESLFKADNSLFSFNKIRIKEIERVYIYKGYIISTSSEEDLLIAFVQKEKND